MYGDSFQAMIQFAAASTANPHLKAIFPTSSGLDMYSAVTCADADNFETPALDPAPKIRLLRDVAHASFVEFPIIRR